MIILGDYHTHTIYSHGKGDIIDNATIAKQKGLKEIAIADHGFSHSLYGVKRNKLDEIKEKIKQAQAETGVKVLLGVEANFTSIDGDIDVNASDMDKLDIILVGFHRFVKTSFKNKIKFFLPNLLGIKSKKVIERNTSAVIKALEKYPIKILTHLGYGFKVDIEKLIPHLLKHGTAVEINGRKKHLTDEEVLLLAEKGVKMVLNSDAHSPRRVGEVNLAINVVERLNIPHELIVNLDKTLIGD